MSGHDPSTTIMVSGLPQADVHRFTPALYKLFCECGVIKEIHYESSRAYIEFEKSRVNTGYNKKYTFGAGTNPILPAVYISLKMRQIESTNFELKANDEENLSRQTIDALNNYKSPHTSGPLHTKVLNIASN